jgi:hypothetical protein
MDEATSGSIFQDENEVRQQLVLDFGTPLALFLQLFKHISASLGSIGTYQPAHHTDPTLSMLALACRSFNSAYHAYHSILLGGYTQAFMLIRHIHEDNLTWDSLRDDIVRRGLWDGSHKSFKDMALAISQDEGEGWLNTYGDESEIAHPRARSLALQMDEGKLRLGPFYDHDFAFAAVSSLLIQTSTFATHAAILADLNVEERQEEWKGEWLSGLEHVRKGLLDWLDDVASQLTPLAANEEGL